MVAEKKEKIAPWAQRLAKKGKTPSKAKLSVSLKVNDWKPKGDFLDAVPEEQAQDDGDEDAWDAVDDASPVDWGVLDPQQAFEQLMQETAHEPESLAQQIAQALHRFELSPLTPTQFLRTPEGRLLVECPVADLYSQISAFDGKRAILTSLVRAISIAQSRDRKSELRTPKEREQNERIRNRVVLQDSLSQATREWQYDTSVAWNPPSTQVQGRVPKPSLADYTTRLFRRWVDGEVAFLRHQKREGHQALGNGSARALYYGVPNASKAFIAELLPRAQVYLTLRNVTAKNAPVEHCVVSGSGTEFLQMDGKFFDSEEQWKTVERRMHRNKPLYRAGIRFFAGELSEPEKIRLHSALKAMSVECKLVFPSKIVAPALQESDFPPLTYEGNQMSHAVTMNEDSPAGSIHVVHHVNAPVFSDLLSTLRDLLQGNEGTEMGAKIVQAVAFVTAFVQGDWSVRAALCVGFLATLRCSSQRIHQWIQQEFLPKFRYQGEENTEADPEPSLLFLVKETLRGLVSVMVEALTSAFAPVGVLVSNLAWYSRVELLKLTAKDLALAIKSLAADVMRRVRVAIEQRSWGPLFDANGDPLKLAETLLMVQENFSTLVDQSGRKSTSDKMAELRESGLLPVALHSPVTIEVYAQQVVLLRDEGTALMSKITNPAVSRHFGTVLSKFSTWASGLAGLVVNANARMTPFSMVFFGAPGTGKSELTSDVFEMLCAKSGKDSSPAARHSWKMMDNFNETAGYHTVGVWLDDADQRVGSISYDTPNYIDWWIQMVNTTPFGVEQPLAELKGKIFTQPAYVFMTTNYLEVAKGLVKDPRAFWRRVHAHVTFCVKQEFRISKDNPGLDKDKAAAADHQDFYTFTVSTFDGSSSDAPITPIARGLNVYQLMPLLAKMDAKHRARELSNLVRRNDPTRCDFCGLVKRKETCPCAELEHVDYEGEPGSDDEEPYTGFSPTASVLQWASELWGRLVSRVNPFPAMRGAVIELRNISVQAVAMLQRFATYLALCLAGIGMVCAAYFVREGRENNGTGIGDLQWKKAHAMPTAKPLPLPNRVGFELEDVKKAWIASRVRVCGAMSGPASIVGPGVILCPSHYVTGLTGDRTVAQLEILRGDTKFTVDVSPFTVFPSVQHPELSYVHVPNLPAVPVHLGNKLWTYVESDVRFFDELAMLTPDDEVQLVGPGENLSFPTSTGLNWRAEFSTAEGFCGSPYVARREGRWFVIGFHFAAYRGNSLPAMAACITKSGMVQELRNMAVVPEGENVALPLDVLGSQYSVRGPEDLSQHSSLRLGCERAVLRGERGPHVYGTMKLFPGGSFKSRATLSALGERSRGLEALLCGSNDFFRIPDFRGEMRGEEWHSLWTNAFATANVGQPEARLMWMALHDYLSVLPELLNEGFRTISEQEAIVGVPGSVTGPLSLNTSVGPPFVGPKRNHVFRGDDGATFLSPQLATLLDAFDSLAEGSNIVAGVALVTPKDEVLARSKVERVFCNMSSAQNLQLKQHLAPVKAFLRANPMAMETMVGIDMTSQDALRILDHMRIYDPSLTQLWDADVKALDKSWSGDFFHLVALAFYAISAYLGTDAQRVYRLVRGLQYTVYYMRGDLFSANWNPSGNDATVELNCLFMSLAERYVFFRQHPELVLPQEELVKYQREFFDAPVPCKLGVFRLSVALMTYGDDMLKVQRGLDAGDYVRIWREEVGAIVTDGAVKTSAPIRKNLAGISFLKRRFVFSADIGRTVTPLDLKSVARMLTYRKDRSLPLAQHLVEVVDAAQRELVYHGEQIYGEVMMFVDEHLASTPYYDVLQQVRLPYLRVVELAKQRDFRAWSVFG